MRTYGVSPDLPEDRRACVARIRKAFDACPRPTREVLAPGGGIDAPYVHKNWGHLKREDVEALDYFGDYLAEDTSYMSSIAFRYFMPSVMVLFLANPERIDFGGFVSIIHRCEEAFARERKERAYCGMIAMTRDQAAAFHKWFGLMITLISEFKLDPFEEEYIARLQALQELAKGPLPDKDHDHKILRAIKERGSRGNRRR